MYLVEDLGDCRKTSVSSSSNIQMIHATHELIADHFHQSYCLGTNLANATDLYAVCMLLPEFLHEGMKLPLVVAMNAMG